MVAVTLTTHLCSERGWLISEAHLHIEIRHPTTNLSRHPVEGYSCSIGTQIYSPL